jgi:hypothetical protein
VKTGRRLSHGLFADAVKTPEADNDLDRLKKFSEDTGFSVEFLKKFEAEYGEIKESSETAFGHGFNIETDQGEYMVFEDDDEAEKEAVARVLEDLESEPEIFEKGWLEGQADMDAVNEELEEIFNESNESYVNDIESEGNRLRDELLERGIITEEEAEDKKFDLEDAKEKMVEEMTKENMDEGIDYIRSNWGKDEASKILLRHIDYDEAAENAVSTDGVAHFLASYDGQEGELDGHYIYRTN